MAQRKTKDFLALKAKWDKKLADSGFEDIEKYNKDTKDLSLYRWDSIYFSNTYEADYFQSKQDYYYKAQQFFNSHKFENSTDRHIWRLHSEGMGLRQISSVLGWMKIHLGRDGVATVVNRLRDEMKKEATAECENET